MPTPETIDARAARLLERLGVGVNLSIDDSTWLCRELQRAREVIRESLWDNDDVSRRVYLGREDDT